MSALWRTQYVESSEGAGEDRVLLRQIGEATLAVLADGAGGMGGGGAAAERIVGGTRSLFGTPSAEDLALWLQGLDADIAEDPRCGEASAVVVLALPDRVVGASVGDSGAWLLTGDAPHELTADQRRRPLLGSGRAMAVGFERPWTGGLVLLGSDGLFRYLPAGVLAALEPLAPPGQAVSALTEGGRLKDGSLQDDLSLILLQRRPEERSAAPPPIPAPAATPGSPKKLLFVDINAGFVRTVAKSFLAEYAIDTAATAAAALAAAASGGYAAVLVDERVPADVGQDPIGGDEVVRQLRQRGYAGPLIAISARDDRNNLMLQAGADTACSKMQFQRINAVLAALVG